jgi:hypothetical protein
MPPKPDSQSKGKAPSRGLQEKKRLAAEASTTPSKRAKPNAPVSTPSRSASVKVPTTPKKNVINLSTPIPELPEAAYINEKAISLFQEITTAVRFGCETRLICRICHFSKLRLGFFGSLLQHLYVE